MWSLTLHDWQYNGKKRKEKRKGKSEALHRMTENTMVKRKKEKPKGKSEALHRMTDNTMVKRKIRNQRGNLKPYIEWQTIQLLKEKGETKGEIWSLTSNDRQYNG